MKKNILISFFMAALVISGCGTHAAGIGDFDLTVYSPRYAEGFSIMGADGRESTLLKVSNPWQGADGVENMLFIRRNGETVPEGFAGEVLEGDASRLVCMSSSHVAMLDAIGAVSAAVGVSGLNNIYNPAVKTSGASEVGYDEYIDYETLVALEPDLVLLYGVTGCSPAEKKLGELGIPYMYVGEYVENTPLGKAEWMVAVAEVLGLRDKAESTFEGIASGYENIKSRVSDSFVVLPEVMLNIPYGDSWFLPPERSYMVRMIEDAGGDYIYKENRGSSSSVVDMEDALLLVSKADVWLNVQQSSIASLCGRYPRFADMPCVKAGKVYNCDRRSSDGGGNDFWESGVVNPDLALLDLVKILHPDLYPDDDLYYYRRLL